MTCALIPEIVHSLYGLGSKRVDCEMTKLIMVEMAAV